MVAPGRSTPRRSASSTIATAIRSFTLPPGFTDSTFATTAAPPGAPGGLERRDLALDRAEHLADRDLAGRPGQMVPARRATLGGQEAGALELEQHLLQVTLRDRLPRRDLLDRDEAARLVHRQVQHRLEGVLSLRGDLHRAAAGPPVEGGATRAPCRRASGRLTPASIRGAA